ncbi:2-hydroxychromene-2-carboxylate isomerase [Neptunomonas qingdaonensis]|uniref:2-hydroxychromene-2-carboxylate isomerase n=1 Tax=Neptunomonas qingdaonensis TaxID=1045558 RepID=A0A1I2S679_9GAMM|nr:2-hydroxychromene-2-carboxylate isomerase [Neptunomonas qingdaonensis]SFG48405.1 2-hydroxychromene-2-carboxylate isomerase [Neptunomonas qingdaonensis]
MAARQLDFYFDYLSPYAYFSWRWIQAICKKYGLTLNAHPVVFGKLLDHWGQLGPAEVPPKKAALYKYCYRYAQLNGFDFNPPLNHPYNPLPALRLSLPGIAGDAQHQLISAIFEAGWSRGIDLASEADLANVLESLGLNSSEMLKAIKTADVKAELRQETAQAIARDVFGVPTFIVDGELFWGNDQQEHLDIYLQGNDPLNRPKVEEMLARHRGIDRKTLIQRHYKK